MSRRALVAMFGLGLIPGCASSQRIDTSFRPAIAEPAYRAGLGPVIWIDEGHNNILTVRADSRYRPFVDTLRADGYAVRPFGARFTSSSLEPVSLLVIGCVRLRTGPAGARADNAERF
jgi:hypothetical protein